MLTLAICNETNHTITITPTIPVGRTAREFPKISFNTPSGVIIHDSCQQELKTGIVPVSVRVRAVCGGNDSVAGVKAIIPSVSQQNSELWHKDAFLPSVWVCICIALFLIKDLCSNSAMC